MDMYDEETGTKMEDEELRAQVIYFISLQTIIEKSQVCILASEALKVKIW